MIWARKKVEIFDRYIWAEEWFCIFMWNFSQREWIFGIIRYDGMPHLLIQNWMFTFGFGKSGYWE